MRSRSLCSRLSKNSLLLDSTFLILSSSVLYPSLITPPSFNKYGASSFIARSNSSQRSVKRIIESLNLALSVPLMDASLALTAGYTLKDFFSCNKSLGLGAPKLIRPTILSKS